MAASPSHVRSHITSATTYRFVVMSGTSKAEKIYHTQFFLTLSNLSISIDTMHTTFPSVSSKRFLFLACYAGNETDKHCIKKEKAPHAPENSYVFDLQIETEEAKAYAQRILDNLLSLKVVESTDAEQCVMNSFAARFDKTASAFGLSLHKTPRELLFEFYQTYGGKKTLDDFNNQAAPVLQKVTETTKTTDVAKEPEAKASASRRLRSRSRSFTGKDSIRAASALFPDVAKTTDVSVDREAAKATQDPEDTEGKNKHCVLS